MSNFVETLDQIDNHFVSNSNNVFMLVYMLIELDHLIQNTNFDINLGLLNALRIRVETTT